jgi:REP element-mobilizing transposase RayT
MQLEAVAKERLLLEQKHPAGIPMDMLQQLQQAEFVAKNQYAGKFDALLDGSSYGPTWLEQPQIATVVTNALHYAEEVLGRWRLLAYCIMPNHVHLVLTGVHPVLHQVLGSVKQYSSRLINQQMGRTGQAFWHAESYDHIIRSQREYHHQVRYVVNNPVKAGLVPDWADWPFTFLRE